HQGLDDWQFGAVIEQMGGEAVAQGVRMNGLGDAGPPGCLTTGMPDGLLRDRLMGAARLQAREHPAVSYLHRAVVGPKLLERFGTEWDSPILAAFAPTDTDHHALFIDVLGPEMA